MESKYKLFRHQIKAIDGCKLHPYRLIYRLPGTGKTFICIELVKKQLSENPNSFILWLGPANLIQQYQKVFTNMNMSFSQFNSKMEEITKGSCIFSSYEMFRLHIDSFIKNEWDCVICDEFHRAKSNTTQINNALKSLRRKSKHFWAFTGTPFQNSPYEFFELINIVSNKNLSFACEDTLKYKRPKKSFFRNLLRKLGFHCNRLNQGPIIGVSKPKRLHDLISEFIDYIPPEQYISECHLPFIDEQIRRVNLDKSELIYYENILKSYRKKREKKFFKDELSDEKIETSFNNLIELRQNLLSMDGKISSKILTCSEDIIKVLKNKSNRVLVFSNFVKYGLEQLAKVLKDKNINFNLYDGNTPSSKRKKILSDYFSGEIPLMLLSPIGFEGLDLYGTTHIFVLDPHFNPERTRQLVSRAIRAYSGVEKINVCHYIAFSEELKNPCIDEVILKISERKKNLALMIEDCLNEDIN